ncbi:hypothetical protein HOY82DRAFT_614309 [Tuber indicum]|nr:hypothetical protein HOY82DRAFT_614309 [Tuber indicum]
MFDKLVYTDDFDDFLGLSSLIVPMDSRKVSPEDFVSVRASPEMARDSSSSSSSSSLCISESGMPALNTLPQGGRALVPITTRLFDVLGTVRSMGPRTYKEVKGIVGGFLVAQVCARECGIANREAFGLLRRYNSAGELSFQPSGTVRSSTSMWAERVSVVEESQLGAVVRDWSCGAGGAKVHVKRRAARPAAEPMRLIAGTLPPAQPSLIGPPTGKSIVCRPLIISGRNVRHEAVNISGKKLMSEPASEAIE